MCLHSVVLICRLKYTVVANRVTHTQSSYSFNPTARWELWFLKILMNHLISDTQTELKLSSYKTQLTHTFTQVSH